MYSLHHLCIVSKSFFQELGNSGRSGGNLCGPVHHIYNFQFSIEPLLFASVYIPNVNINCCICIELKECLTVIGFLLVSGLSACKKLNEVMAGFRSCMLLIFLFGGEGNLYNMCAAMCRDGSPSHY